MIILYQICAIILILTGFAIVPLPIPFGALMIAVGLTILIGSSRPFAAFVKARRSRSPRIHRLLGFLENRSPARLRDVLKRSDPDPQTLD